MAIERYKIFLTLFKMEKSKVITATTALTTLAVGIGIGASILAASAQDNTTVAPTANTAVTAPAQGMRGGMGFGMKGLNGIKMQNIQTSVEYLDNGTKETLTSTDQDTIAALQKRADKTGKIEFENANKNVTVTTEKISNGIIVTRTSTDAEEVVRIKNRAQMMELMKSLKDSGVDVQDSITRTVTNTNNGVQVTISSDNADVAKLIQLRAANAPEKGGMGLGMEFGKEGRFGKHGGRMQMMQQNGNTNNNQ